MIFNYLTNPDKWMMFFIDAIISIWDNYNVVNILPIIQISKPMRGFQYSTFANLLVESIKNMSYLSANFCSLSLFAEITKLL